MVTGYHPDRLSAVEAAIDELSGATADDALDLLRGLVALQKELAEETTRAISETDLLRSAIRHLSSTPTIWDQAYPAIEQVSVAGVSMLTASLEDFLRTIGDELTIDVTLYLREGTGPAIAEQLRQQDQVFDPGSDVL
jgi:ATP-dependent helicase/nuclease subunit B